jgi:hypothetical protein
MKRRNNNKKNDSTQNLNNKSESSNKANANPKSETIKSANDMNGHRVNHQSNSISSINQSISKNVTIQKRSILSDSSFIFSSKCFSISFAIISLLFIFISLNLWNVNQNLENELLFCKKFINILEKDEKTLNLTIGEMMENITKQYSLLTTCLTDKERIQNDLVEMKDTISNLNATVIRGNYTLSLSDDQYKSCLKITQNSRGSKNRKNKNNRYSNVVNQGKHVFDSNSTTPNFNSTSQFSNHIKIVHEN